MEGGNRELAAWLVARRVRIERVMARRLGPAAPAPEDPETEALRRFRSFAAASLLRGDAVTPALDGVRTRERRVIALLEAWIEAADSLAGDEGPSVRAALEPLVEPFRVALRSTRTSRRAGGAPRTQRRAVSAAIDRIADAFLAIDVDAGTILDANPAAGALLRIKRDALLGVDAMRFVPKPEQRSWWTELDAIAESDDPRAFHGRLCDATGSTVPVDVTLTRCRARGRVLALVMARPVRATAPRAAEREPLPYSNANADASATRPAAGMSPARTGAAELGGDPFGPARLPE